VLNVIIYVETLIGELSRNYCFVTICATTNGHQSKNSFYFCPLKQSKLLIPQITCNVTETANGSFNIELETDVVAPFLYVTAPNNFGRFSDNGFPLLPGKKLNILYFPWDSNKNLENFKKSVNIKSLRNTY
jgi:hypothetical protein